jgi:hypothetical protein
MEEQDLKLDGNAAAGLLRELFTFELTTARGCCENCGAVAEVGAVIVYANAPSGGGRYWLDARGISWLEIRA